MLEFLPAVRFQLESQLDRPYHEYRLVVGADSFWGRCRVILPLQGKENSR